VLDQRLARLNVQAHEWGEALRISAPPAGAPAHDARAAVQEWTLPHAAMRPWAPAHLRAVRDGTGAVRASWIRCARSGGETWEGEPPLADGAESYRLEVFDDGALVRAAETPAPAWTYPAVEQVADFGALPASITLSVAQIGSSGRPGLKTRLTITL
jgi:hypothetical protein